MSDAVGQPVATKTPPITDKEHAALKAVYQGQADEYQQRLALKVIVNTFSRAHDVSYVPGSFDQSAFLAGRGYVGQIILKYLNLPIGRLPEGDNHNE